MGAQEKNSKEFLEHAHGRHCDTHFVYIITFTPHSNLMRERSRVLKPKFNGSGVMPGNLNLSSQVLLMSSQVWRPLRWMVLLKFYR